MKIIKRVSFGYRNFINFRNRMLLGFNSKLTAL
ncbi:transposase [Brochothrix thermosphacta]